jgi:TetR/AcrR family transcriptional regulator
MPNTAFFNLPEHKRSLIISVSIDEFSSANYDTASINQICKKSNIAKGSFYQYFTDKLDLYSYIMTIAIESKVSFFATILENFKTLTLQEQISFLFIQGIEFAKKNPHYAALGEQFSKESNEHAKQAIMKEGEKRSDNLFTQMIEHAKLKGEISNKVDTLALSMMLQSLNRTVNEYMLSKYGGTSLMSFNEDTNIFVNSLLDIIFNGIKSI